MPLRTGSAASSKPMGVDEEFFTVVPKASGNRHSREDERRLEAAITAGVDVIVIEGDDLGAATASMITFGNFMHKGAVLSTLGFLGVSSLPRLPVPVREFSVGLGGFGVSCAVGYGFLWAHDPLCKYQNAASGEALRGVPTDVLTSDTNTVLVKKDDSVRKGLHNVLALVVALVIACKLCRQGGNAR